MAATTYFVVWKEDAEKPNFEGLNQLFQIVVPIGLLGGILVGSLLAKSRCKALQMKSDLKEKLSGYRAALILKYALIEGPVLFAVVCYFLTKNMFFMGLAACAVVLFMSYRPTKSKAIYDLELNEQEVAMLEDPDAIVAETKSN